jgi:opacity protein-like surface antigen
MIKKIVMAAVLAASFASIATPASAVVYVRAAPPEPRVEVMPAPRANKTWVAGHYEYRNNRYRWIAGTWVQTRRGHVYHQPQWTESNGRWSYQQGNWKRGDADHDGVPNSQDRAPNNPGRS